MNKLSQVSLLMVLVSLAGCGGGGTAPAPHPEPQIIKPQFSFDPGLLDRLNRLAISPDGKLLLYGVQVWNLETKEKLFTLDHHNAATRPAAISPDGKVAAYSLLYSVPLIDLATGKELRTFREKEPPFGGFLNDLYFSPKGDLLITATGKTIIGWDVLSGEQRFTWSMAQEVVALSNYFDDGKKIASAVHTREQQLTLWDVASRKPVRTLDAGDDRIQRIAVSGDGKRLATRHTLGKVRIWDVATGFAVKIAEEMPSLFSPLAFVNQQTLAYVSGPPGRKSDQIILVNAETGKTTHRLQGHTENVQALAVTPDGTRLVSSGKDRMIHVWDLSGVR